MAHVDVWKRGGVHFYLSAFFIIPIIVSCSPKTTFAPQSIRETPIYSQDKKLLVKADSLFKNENYELAIRVYTKIRDEFPQTTSGVIAQYKLGYINIFFGNPFADYRAALREFKRFQNEYPNDKNNELVNNWIRLLTVFEDFEGYYNKGSESMEEWRRKEKEILKNYETLQDAYLRCDAETDSLKRHIQKLEGIIEYIDRAR